MGARSRCQWDRGRGECHLRWRAGRRHFRGSQSAAARDLRQRFPQRHPPQPRCRLTAPSLPPPHRPSLVPATDVWISAVSKASLGGTAWRCEGAQHNAGSGCGANTLAVKMLVPVEASPGGRGGGGGSLLPVRCSTCSAACAVLQRGARVVPPVAQRPVQCCRAVRAWCRPCANGSPQPSSLLSRVCAKPPCSALPSSLSRPGGGAAISSFVGRPEPLFSSCVSCPALSCSPVLFRAGQAVLLLHRALGRPGARWLRAAVLQVSASRGGLIPAAPVWCRGASLPDCVHTPGE